MNHKYLAVIFVFFLVSCSQDIPVNEKQYYAIYTHNNSDEKINRVKVYRNNSSIIEFSVGNLIPKALDVRTFLYIPPEKELTVRWKDIHGTEYEKPIDLNGIFPSKFNGGNLHIVIKKDFSIDYTFVMNKTVYSQNNRTAQ